MLTKNFYSHVLSTMSGKTIASGITDTSGTVYGCAYYCGLNVLSWMHSADAGSISSNSVRFGSGVTPSTPDDYTIESIITSGMTVTKPSDTSVSVDGNAVSFSATYGVQNTQTVDVTISEICLFSYIRTTENISKNCLIDRTVLETPIVINPGQTKQITYTIRFNYPTA